MENSNLPVVQKNTLPAKIKKSLSSRAGKAAIFGSLTVLSAGLLYSAAFLSPIGLPAFAYSALGLAKNTVLRSFKDLAFVVRNKKDSIKISQDTTRMDLMTKLIGKSRSEKVAFMQLQAIVGLSKINSLPENLKGKRIETDTHGIVSSTFKKLNDLGIISDLSVEPKTNLLGKQKKSSHLIEKLAIGNVNPKNLFINKENIEKVSFSLANEVNINDKKLKETFPFVFGKEGSKKHIGILAKYGWKIINNPDGSLSIDYGSKKKNRGEETLLLEAPSHNNEHDNFIQSLKDNNLTLDKQAEFSKDFREKDNKSLDNQKSGDEYQK